MLHSEKFSEKALFVNIIPMKNLWTIFADWELFHNFISLNSPKHGSLESFRFFFSYQYTYFYFW